MPSMVASARSCTSEDHAIDALVAWAPRCPGLETPNRSVLRHGACGGRKHRNPHSTLMHFIAAFALIGLLTAMPAAAEKTQEATGAVAPKADVSEKQAQSAQRKASADWIKRCDKLEGDRRMECLEDVRKEIVQRFENDGGESEQQRRAESRE